MSKKVLFLILLFFVIPVSVRSEVLIHIEVGDSWVYTVETSSDTQNVQTVNFTVVSFSYMGSSLDKIRVNKIQSDLVIESFFFEYYLNRPYTVIDNYYNSSLTITLDNFSIISDTIYKTARGNLLFNRTSDLNISVTLTDVIIQNERCNDTTAYIIAKVREQTTNPTIIEPLSTGVVKSSQKEVILEGKMFISELKMTFDMFFYAYNQELYEASNEFIFKDQKVRNLTITRDEFIFSGISMFAEDSDYSFISEEWDISIGEFKTVEDWIFSFDVGLPLEVVKHNQINPSNAKLTVNTIPEIFKMNLVDADLINSDYNFKEVETQKTSFIFYVLLISIMSITALTKKIKT